MRMKYVLATTIVLAACGGPAAPPRSAAASLATDLPTMHTCWNGGDVLLRETTRALDHHARPDVLTILASGAWHVEGTRTRSGCLSADQLAALESRLQVVRRDAPDAPTCAGLPTHETLLEVPGVGALSYRWPCAPGPDAETAAGLALARDLTRATAIPPERT